MRDDVLDLHKVMQKLEAHPCQSVKHLHLYTDRLTFSGPTVAEIAQLTLPSKQPVHSIRIFARSVLQEQYLKGIRITNVETTFKLHIHFESCNEDFLILNESNVPCKLSKQQSTVDGESAHMTTEGRSNAVGIAGALMASTCVGRSFLVSNSKISGCPIANVPATNLDPLTKNDLRNHEARLRRNQYVAPHHCKNIPTNSV